MSGEEQRLSDELTRAQDRAAMYHANASDLQGQLDRERARTRQLEQRSVFLEAEVQQLRESLEAARQK